VDSREKKIKNQKYAKPFHKRYLTPVAKQKEIGATQLVSQDYHPRTHSGAGDRYKIYRAAFYKRQGLLSLYLKIITHEHTLGQEHHRQGYFS